LFIHSKCARQEEVSNALNLNISEAAAQWSFLKLRLCFGKELVEPARIRRAHRGTERVPFANLLVHPSVCLTPVLLPD
jgi:hypothetical protein